MSEEFGFAIGQLRAGEGKAEAFRTFWEVYAPLRDQLDAEMSAAAMNIPELAAALRAQGAEQLAREQARSRKALEEALVSGRWESLFEALSQQGRAYAEMGVTFGAWFELLALFRARMRQVLDPLARTDLARAQRAREGMDLYIDAAMARIGEAYLTAKEVIIRRQQEAIKELSTPVLTVRDRLLIIPVIGMVDTHRARQVTEALLRAIRERRALAVVMDITGVPIVDSRVANHLVQACEAARLMGTHVLMTGISASIAQALVTIGAELRGVPTLGDLQTGIEEAERILRARLATDAQPTAGSVPVAAPRATSGGR